MNHGTTYIKPQRNAPVPSSKKGRHPLPYEQSGSINTKSITADSVPAQTETSFLLSGSQNKKNKKPHKLTILVHVDESLSFEEQIAQRAHELFEQRGREHGADLADWFQAEREVAEWHEQREQARRA